MSTKPKTKKVCQSRNWCFTSFENIDWEKLFDNYKDIIRYLCVGDEICPKTGKKHKQGWLQFVNKKRLGGVKKIIGCNKIHLKACKGTAKENDKYCQKDGNFICFGKYKTQGQRTDLEKIKKMINNDVPMLEIANDHFGDFLRYHQGLYKYKELLLASRANKFRKLNVNVYWGETGKGKTRKAVEENINAFKIQADQLNWWDG
jgi:uncharacterized protein involved in high-affinity Fe2+ transport